MQLNELLSGVVVLMRPQEEIEITSIAFDSRKVEKGSLFCCIPGTKTDGHDYAKMAMERGAAALVGAIGTALGVTAGSILPARLVSALSVALFGMFLAIIIPPSKKNPVVLGCVAVSFAASWLCTVLPYVKTLSEGTRTILLTILIASAAALLFPVKDAPEQKEGSQDER